MLAWAGQVIDGRLCAARCSNEQNAEKQSDMSNSSHWNLLSKLPSPILTTIFTLLMYFFWRLRRMATTLRKQLEIP
jgi:hypothetical protein